MSEKAQNGDIEASPARSIASDHSEGIEIIENGDHLKSIQITEDYVVGEEFGTNQKGEIDVQNDQSLQSVRCVVGGFVSGLDEIQSGFLIVEGAKENEEVHEGHKNEGLSQNTNLFVKENSAYLAYDLMSGSGDMPLDQKEVHVGKEKRESSPSAQNISEMPIHENVEMVGNGAISCDDGCLGESQEPELEDQQDAKRTRLTPPDEGEECHT